MSEKWCFILQFLVVYLLSPVNGRPTCLTTKRHVMWIDQSQRSLAIGHMIKRLICGESRWDSPQIKHCLSIKNIHFFFFFYIIILHNKLSYIILNFLPKFTIIWFLIFVGSPCWSTSVQDVLRFSIMHFVMAIFPKLFIFQSFYWFCSALFCILFLNSQLKTHKNVHVWRPLRSYRSTQCLNHKCVSGCSLPSLGQYYTCRCPIDSVNMPVWASTGLVLVRCWQHWPSTGPVLAHYGMFLGYSIPQTIRVITYQQPGSRFLLLPTEISVQIIGILMDGYFGSRSSPQQVQYWLY